MSSLRVKSLATGSNGNVILVLAGETSVLVDCGLSTRSLERYLQQTGVDPASLSAILLTHEHTDHILSAGVMARRYGIPVVANRRTLEAAAGALGNVSAQDLATGSSRTFGQMEAASFPIPHDAAEPVGYLLSHGDWSVCVILDAGKPSYEMRRPLRQADLIVIEANHEREKVITGPYDRLLKARILSDVGHLSNVEAAQLLSESANGQHKWAWLAHLSEVNNTPRLAMRTVSHFLRHEGVKNIELSVSQRERPSVHWDSATAVWQDTLLSAILDHPEG